MNLVGSTSINKGILHTVVAGSHLNGLHVDALATVQLTLQKLLLFFSSSRHGCLKVLYCNLQRAHLGWMTGNSLDNDM